MMNVFFVRVSDLNKLQAGDYTLINMSTVSARGLRSIPGLTNAVIATPLFRRLHNGEYSLEEFSKFCKSSTNKLVKNKIILQFMYLSFVDGRFFCNYFSFLYIFFCLPNMV